MKRYLAVAREFQLGADILPNAVAPSWGKAVRVNADPVSLRPLDPGDGAG